MANVSARVGPKPLRLSGIALNIGRAVLLLAALVLLARIRSGVPIYVYFAAAAVSMSAIWLTVRNSADLKPWAIYLGAFLIFAQLRTFADETSIPTQYAYAIDAEKALFVGTIPTIWLQDQLYSFGNISFLDSLAILVYVSYFVFPHLTIFMVWRLDREKFPVYAAAVIGVVYTGLMVSVLVPTAPPWLAGQTGDLPHVFRITEDVSNEVTPAGYQSAYQAIGPNDVAAMPSLHTAIPAVIAMIAWSRTRRTVAVAAWVYLAAMAFSLVYLGEHYVVDILAGIAAAGLVTLLITWWLRRSGEDARSTMPRDQLAKATPDES